MTLNDSTVKETEPSDFVEETVAKNEQKEENNKI